jgi:hypothetical protein
LSILGLASASCGDESPAPGEQNDAAADQPSAAPTGATDAETILHHWQALTAIHAEDVGDAIHHVEHIIDVVHGDHQSAMRGILHDLEGKRLHLAEHAIGEMLAAHAEPNLSPAMIHLQLGMTALGRDDRFEAMHHVTHFVDAASDADATHGRAALDALRNDQSLDAALHLSAAARLDVERQQTARRCSGDGVAHPGIRDGRIALVLVVDDEWSDKHGAVALETAVSVVEQARTAMRDLGIALDVVGVERWESPSDGDLHDLSHAALVDNPLPNNASLLLVLTDQETAGRTDGVHSHSAGSHAIAVRHHRDSPQQDALVFVHEIGHMLDLTHEAGTYMQARGFVDDPAWSQCQHEAVQRLIADTTT